MIADVHVLMTVYNESKFLDYALRACIPHVKTVTVVEGAYRETMALGAPARSNDGTLDILTRHKSDKVHVIHANERSDADQRNVGLRYIQRIDPHGWMMICDGDECYQPFTFKLISALTRKMERAKQECAIFKSLTFVNDFDHYCEQYFPRLFQLIPSARFVNDNAFYYDHGWPNTIRCDYIDYHHYSFCKGAERFAMKKQWWETRFKKPFDYGWHMNEDGQIADSNHVIKPYTGKHPDIMRELINK